ncbi:MAG: hypothetical protein H7X70_02235 [Candidatus Kapabacteria bacterium]|nr:hypothetical protein [Candidatus Kapabacteria bacterium]
MNKLTISCIVLLIVLGVVPALAQDSHYWTNQYGTESWLLGGAVVGSTTDLASTFYNPAALAFYPVSTAIQTSVSLNWSRTAIEAKDLDFQLVSGSSSPLPTLVSLNLPLKILGSRALQLSYLKRTDVKLNLSGISYTGVGADTGYVVTGLIDRELVDSWFGLTWSRAFGKEHSLGITAYISAVSSSYQSVLATGVVSKDAKASSSLSDYQSFDNIRFLAKAGYYYDGRPVSFGISITTPSIKILNTIGETRTSQTSIVNDSVVSLYGDRQVGLTAKYRTPISVAAGATWYSKQTTVYLTLEWFDGLDPYAPLQPEPFMATIPASTIIYGNTVKRYGIANVGLGIRQRVGEKTSLYFSILRDGSSLKPSDNAADAIVNYDLYHATVGWQFTIVNTVVTAGAIVGGGYVDNAPPSEFGQYVGLTNGVNVSRYFLRIGAVIGIVARL